MRTHLKFRQLARLSVVRVVRTGSRIVLPAALAASLAACGHYKVGPDNMLDQSTGSLFERNASRTYYKPAGQAAIIEAGQTNVNPGVRELARQGGCADQSAVGQRLRKRGQWALARNRGRGVTCP